MELHEQAQRKQERNIQSYKANENNIRNSQQETRRRTVLICDDERDLLLMFAIELQTKYNVLTAKSGEHIRPRCKTFRKKD